MNKHLKYALLPLDAAKKKIKQLSSTITFEIRKLLEMMFVASTSMNSPSQCVPVWYAAALYWSKWGSSTGHKSQQLLLNITFLFPVYFVCALHLAIMYILSWQTEERGGAHGRTFLHKSVNTYTADRHNTWRTRGPSQVAPTHTTNNTHPLTTLHRLACWHSSVIFFFFF